MGRHTVNQFSAELNRRLEAIREQNLFRELRRVDSTQSSRIEINGRSLLNFSSNDYLGLADHPHLKEAAVKAVKHFGAGSGASRLICGSLGPHHELEEALAEFKQSESALAFSSGYAAAVGTICALMGKEDIVVIDKLVHASIVDAARLCGAKLRVYPHNNLNKLEDILRWADKQAPASGKEHPRKLLVTESVFSMDGDQASLAEIVALKEKYGAWLMVDEAHATGLFGEHRRGLAEQSKTSEQIEIQMGTLGKAMGASGGYVCGTKVLIEYLINRARSFIFSTAPVPAAAAAARAGVEVLRSVEGRSRCGKLWQSVHRIKQVLNQTDWQDSGSNSAIIPLILGDEGRAMEVANALRELGIFIPAVRYPTVARGEARLRLTLTASHTADELETLITHLAVISKNAKAG